MKVREATRLFVKVLEARARAITAYCAANEELQNAGIEHRAALHEASRAEADALEALKVSGKLQLNLETFDAIGVRCAKAEVRLRAARSEYASAQELVIHLKDQRDDAFASFTEPDTREAHGG